MNKQPILTLLDEGASTNVIGKDIAKQWNLLDKIENPKTLKAISPGSTNIPILGQTTVIFQVEHYKIPLKVTIIKGNQAYLLLSEVAQAKLGITKDRKYQIARIIGIPISWQDMFLNQLHGFKRLYKNLLADKPSRTLENNRVSGIT
ncbi:hypothetical protein F8M41_007834 [Gigaspora margarita]|uniref:Uncharacterized protein n=1 Tax=Gigaspora margarita TaxID=4874 RepID=A0A8H4AW20_GIGMA|nr:hypothetical protein F8M41_007834 [Gigaspora margarita]